MDLTIANVALQLFACAMLLTLIIYQLTSRYRSMPANRVFLLILCLNIATLLADTIAWAFDGSPGAAWHMLLWCANFFGYSFGMLISVALLVYIAISIPLEDAAVRRLAVAGTAVLAAFFAVLAFAQHSGLVFYLDGSNVFRLGAYYWVPYTFGGSMFFSIILMVLHYRKRLGTRKTLTFISYPLIITIGIIGNLFFQHLMVASAALALATLIIFLNIQVHREKQLAQKEAELAESRIAVMLSQIQPHFLYNCLSAIENLCVEDPPQAREAVHDFSKYLRGNLDSLGKHGLIPFRQELGHVRTYVALEQKRYLDELTVSYEIEACDFLLPPLTVQPIVENAVRHGVGKNLTGGAVALCTDETEHHWRVTITDNGAGFAEEGAASDGRSHIGLENVHARLASMCGGTLQVTSTPGAGTTATILIPKGERLQ